MAHPWNVSSNTPTIIPGSRPRRSLVVIMVHCYEMRVALRDKRASVSPQDMIRLMNQGALLIDLRPAEQYAGGPRRPARAR